MFIESFIWSEDLLYTGQPEADGCLPMHCQHRRPTCCGQEDRRQRRVSVTGQDV